MQDLRVGQPGYGKAIRCECRYGENEIRRNNYLRKIDGLSEEERALRFWDLNLEGNQPAVRQIQEIMMRRTGLITLTGKAGTGKTSLMICAVNQARQGNVPAVYTTVTDLLDYLRAAYAPHTELSFDARWELLVNVDVLAVDELDEFNTTPWAMERFERLVDERWRALSTKLTLFATNSPLDRLPEKVASRLRDGRSQWCRFDGMDMRPLQSWGDRE